jgi:hypothetical protein
MATRQMFDEILADEFSSQSQKDQAQAGLYRLDNPERNAVTEIDLTAAADPKPSATIVAKLAPCPIHLLSLVVSGINYTDPAEG